MNCLLEHTTHPPVHYSLLLFTDQSEASTRQRNHLSHWVTGYCTGPHCHNEVSTHVLVYMIPYASLLLLQGKEVSDDMNSLYNVMQFPILITDNVYRCWSPVSRIVGTWYMMKLERNNIWSSCVNSLNQPPMKMWRTRCWSWFRRGLPRSATAPNTEQSR